MKSALPHWHLLVNPLYYITTETIRLVHNIKQFSNGSDLISIPDVKDLPFYIFILFFYESLLDIPCIPQKYFWLFSEYPFCITMESETSINNSVMPSVLVV